MKYLVKILFLIVWWAGWSCKDCALWNLKELSPCDFSADFDILKEAGCTVPCTVRFTPRLLGDQNLKYKWIIDGITIDSIVVTHVFTTPGDHNVTLSISGYGCDQDSSKVCNIGDPSPVAAFMPADTLVVAPSTITFTQKSTNASTFEWLLDGVSVQNGPQFTYTFTCDDTLNITLRATGSGGTNAITHQVIVRPVMFDMVKKRYGSDSNRSENAFGVDEAANGEFYLFVNDGKVNYLVKANPQGAGNVISSHNLSNQYSQLSPTAYAKTTTGYLLLGNALKPDLTTDFFILKTNTGFGFFNEKAFSKSLASDSEKAYGVAEILPAGNYLVAGEGTWSGAKGMYFSTVTQGLTSATHKQLFSTDQSAVAKAIAPAPNGGFWAVGTSITNNQTFFFRLNSDLTLNGDPIPIGLASFQVLKIIVWDSQTAIILGIESNAARVVKISGNSAAATWSFQHLFRDGLRNSAGRLIFVGQDAASQMPAWFEVNIQSGIITRKELLGTPSIIDAGLAMSIAETKDCGFIIAGQGAKVGEAYQTILTKTDKNGQTK